MRERAMARTVMEIEDEIMAESGDPGNWSLPELQFFNRLSQEHDLPGEDEPTTGRDGSSDEFAGSDEKQKNVISLQEKRKEKKSQKCKKKPQKRKKKKKGKR